MFPVLLLCNWELYFSNNYLNKKFLIYHVLKRTKKSKTISPSSIQIYNPIQIVLRICDCEFLIAMKILVRFKTKNVGRMQHILMHE